MRITPESGRRNTFFVLFLVDDNYLFIQEAERIERGDIQVPVRSQ